MGQPHCTISEACYPLTPDKEDDGQGEGNDERSDEARRGPSVDGALSESEDEADQSAHHDHDADNVQTLPSRGSVRSLRVGRLGVRQDEVGDDGEEDTQDGDDSEEPSVVGQHGDTGENEAEDVADGTGETEQGQLGLLGCRVREHVDGEMVSAGNGHGSCDTTESSEDEEAVLVRGDKRVDEGEDAEAEETTDEDDFGWEEVTQSTSEQEERGKAK
jgi:hypothetical protein